jgi:hypothetical protein
VDAVETLLEGRAITQNGQHSPADSVPPRPAARTAAYVLSGAIAALMIAASLAGLLVDGLYREGAWAREAFRGGDVITLTIAAPLLIISLIMSIRGSHRAESVWIGLIVYALYNYAYAAFGAAFNDVFLLHIALFSMSVFALACAIPNLDLAAIARTFRDAIGARTIGVFLVIVGAGQGGLWIFLVVRNAITGEVLHEIPVWGQHLVFALDLALLVPSLVLAGVLLARRRPFGFLLGTAMAVFGAVYQLNLMVASVFQDRADVAGVQAFAPESLLLTATFVAASGLLLLPRRSVTR